MHIWPAVVLELYIMFLILFGLIGNVMTYILLKQHIFNESITICFKLLALLEVIVMLISLPMVWAVSFFGLKEGSSPLCRYHAMLLFMCSLNVDWIVVLVTGMRYVYIAHPLHAYRICSKFNIVTCLCIIFVTSSVFSIVVFRVILYHQLPTDTEALRHSNCFFIWYYRTQRWSVYSRLLAAVWPLLLPSILITAFSFWIISHHRRIIHRERMRKAFELAEPVKSFIYRRQEAEEKENARKSSSVDIAVGLSTPSSSSEMCHQARLYKSLGLPALLVDSSRNLITHSKTAISMVAKDMATKATAVSGTLAKEATVVSAQLVKEATAVSSRPTLGKEEITKSSSQGKESVKANNSTQNPELQVFDEMSDPDLTKHYISADLAAMVPLDILVPRQRRIHSQLMPANRGQALQWVVLGTNFAFIAFRAPCLIWFVIGEHLATILGKGAINDQYFFITVMTVLYTHHAILFVIYCCTGSKFRKGMTRFFY